MLTTIIKRLLQGILVLVAVMILIFVLLRLIPGDPARMIKSVASEEAVQALRHEMGIDRSIPEQFVSYLKNLAHGNLGYSWFQKADVSDVIAQCWTKTAVEMAFAIVPAIVFGFIFGVLAAMYPHKWIDKLISTISVIEQSLPNYWIAIMLIQVLCAKLGLFPASGYKNYRYAILPALIIMLPLLGIIVKNVRTNMIGSFSQDFVKAARARGVPGIASLFGYALRNSLIPIITIIGAQLGGVLGNCVIIEYIFSIQGIGLNILNAIIRRDYLMVQALVMLVSAVFVIVNTLIDISYLYLDPRIRKAQGGL